MRSSFKVVQVDTDRVFIIDLDQGMSVTNDAENVAKHIQQRYPGKRLVYRDTMSNWDEILFEGPHLFQFYDDYLPEGY